MMDRQLFYHVYESSIRLYVELYLTSYQCSVCMVERDRSRTMYNNIVVIVSV